MDRSRLILLGLFKTWDVLRKAWRNTRGSPRLKFRIATAVSCRFDSQGAPFLPAAAGSDGMGQTPRERGLVLGRRLSHIEADG